MNNKESKKQAIIMLCRASRKAQRLTLIELGNRSGYHYTTLSKFENGKFNWDIVAAYVGNVLNAAERDTVNNLIEEVKKQ